MTRYIHGRAAGGQLNLCEEVVAKDSRSKAHSHSRAESTCLRTLRCMSLSDGSSQHLILILQESSKLNQIGERQS